MKKPAKGLSRPKTRLPDALYDKAPASLDQALAYLRLGHIAESYREACTRAASEETSRESFLTELVLEEARSWWETTVRHRLRSARFPVVKTIDTFDFAHPNKCNRRNRPTEGALSRS